MIIVTGATGQLGHAIVKSLVTRIPADQVGVSVRDVSKAANLEALGIRVRAGDFCNSESLLHAFEGAEQAMLVSSNARASGGDPLAQHQAAIEAAKAVGAKRVVYTSQMAASDSSAFPPARDHAATEHMLQESGLAWTALRNGFYAASGILLLGDALRTAVIEAPADGKVAWTAHADLAEAAAIILAQEGMFNGPTPPLTSSLALDFADLAAILSELLGKSIARKTLTDDDLRAKISARGAPESAVNIAVGLYLASRNGEFSMIDPTLERLLGRCPVSMRDLLVKKLEVG